MDKSLQVIEEQVTKCLVAGSALAVTNQKEYDNALIIGKKVSALLKMIDDDEKKITKPINDSLKLIREKYKPFKNKVEAVKQEIKDKMELWFKEEEKNKRIEEERINARLEKGTLKESTAVNKLATLEMNKAQTSGGMTSVLKVKLIDIKQVPAEYLLINESAIKSAFREGKEISGVNCFYEKSARL